MGKWNDFRCVKESKKKRDEDKDKTGSIRMKYKDREH